MSRWSFCTRAPACRPRLCLGCGGVSCYYVCHGDGSSSDVYVDRSLIGCSQGIDNRRLARLLVIGRLPSIESGAQRVSHRTCQPYYSLRFYVCTLQFGRAGRANQATHVTFFTTPFIKRRTKGTKGAKAPTETDAIAQKLELFLEYAYVPLACPCGGLHGRRALLSSRLQCKPPLLTSSLLCAALALLLIPYRIKKLFSCTIA